MDGAEKPLVSVIVPVYKAEKYIAKCIESILNQTYENLELLLVDDGSPDSSGEICENFATQDGRIKVIHTPNGGVSRARNTGLDNAQGIYVCFVDSDDWVSATYIEDLLPQQDEDLVHSGLIYVMDGTIIRKCECEPHVVEQEQWKEDIQGSLSKGPVMGPVANCYRRDIIEAKHLRFDTSIDIAEDIVFNMNYLSNCKKTRFVENCDYYYTVSKGSSLMDRHHDCRTIGMMMVAQAKERLTGKTEYRVRWDEWQIAVAHHRKWLKESKGEKRKEVLKCLCDSYRNEYFRQSIPFIRKHGSLDQKVETFFMRRLLHPLYPRFYQIIVYISRLKHR